MREDSTSVAKGLKLAQAREMDGFLAAGKGTALSSFLFFLLGKPLNCEPKCQKRGAAGFP